MATRTIVRRQIRGFVTAWTALTVFVAVATFFAIYLTYGTNNLNFTPTTGNIALPVVTETPAQVAVNVTAASTLENNNAAQSVIPTATTETNLPAPTMTPTDEPVEAASTTQEVVSVAQAATDVPVQETPTMTATTPPIQDTRFQVGIQVQPDPGFNPQYQDNWMREANEKLGLGWVKIQIRWEDVEPVKGEYEWKHVRFPLTSAKTFGVKVMLSVVTAPDWAREPGIDLEKHGPPANAQDYVNFVSAMVEKFQGDIHAIEVWNEQNLDREWMSTGGLDAQNYVNLLRQTYNAVKAIDPNIIIISGALSPGGGWVESDGRVSAIDDFPYMDAMIAAGVLNYADCIGAHHNGYNIGPSVLWDEVEDDPEAQFRGPFDNPHHSWSLRSTLEEYARKIQLAGGKQPLCVTEFGWASTEDLDGTPPGFEFAADNTLEEQKTWTVEALDNMQEWGFVWLAFVWNFNYGPQAGWDPTNDNVPYSIIGPDWVHRPVYDALGEWQKQRLANNLP